MYALCERLFPLRRSLTGDGVRQTLAALHEHAPLEVREVPSGTPILDWTVPREWNIRDAWIEGPDGRRVVDFRRLEPPRGRLQRAGARADAAGRAARAPPHPARPARTWIPYRTSYYERALGLLPRSTSASRRCAEGEYEVCIDATLGDGSLTYGE